MIYGKGGPYGTSSKHRVVPMSSRVQALLEHHFALHDNSVIDDPNQDEIGALVGPGATVIF